MYCLLTFAMLMANTSIADLPCDKFASVEPKPKTISNKVVSLNPNYVPQTDETVNQIKTTSVYLEPHGSLSTLVVNTTNGVFRTDVSSKYGDRFVCLLRKLMAVGYPIKDIGCYVKRRIAGTRFASLHSFGKACDINQDSRNVVSVRQPQGTTEMARACGLESGAEWKMTPDTGHFEVPTEGYGLHIAKGEPQRQPWPRILAISFQDWREAIH